MISKFNRNLSMFNKNYSAQKKKQQLIFELSCLSLNFSVRFNNSLQIRTHLLHHQIEVSYRNHDILVGQTVVKSLGHSLSSYSPFYH